MSAIKAQVDLLGIEPKSKPYIETVLHAYFIFVSRYCLNEQTLYHRVAKSFHM